MSEEIDKGFMDRFRKPKKEQQAQAGFTDDQKIMIDVFSVGRGVSNKQAQNWLYQNNWKLPSNLMREYNRRKNVFAKWQEVLKKDKKDMRVGRVYSSDRPGKKIMMLTHEGKKIHAGAKGYGNYKGKGKNRGGGTHTNKKRRKNFKSRHNCDQCKGRITTPKCLACKKLW